jgi:hypothetical protein
MIKLKATSLDLFRYTLKQGLGIPANQTEKHYQQFLNNIIDQLPTSITCQRPQENRQKFLNIAIDRAILPFAGTIANHQIEGQYRRYIEKDNYQLYFTGYDNTTSESYGNEQIISLINQLKNLIPPPPAQLYHLGQTWLLSGCLTSDYTNAEITEFIQSISQNILLKTTDNPIPEPLTGQYAGSSILQYWGNTKDNQHLFIILFSNTDDTIYLSDQHQYIKLWLDILCYRHKIIWAHQNSEKLRTQLVNYYNDITAMQSLSGLNLQKLKEAMEKLSKFVIALNYLEMQASTIRVNAEKYINKLSEMSAQIPHSNLSFLNDFENQINLYQKEIKKDLENFRPCLEVLRSLTETIRGTVEIRKAESDRQFQTIIGIGGLGVGVASVVASAVAGQIQEIQSEETLNKIIVTMPFPPSWSNLQYILGISLISGIFSSLFAYIIVKLFTFYQSKKFKNIK